MVGKFPLKLKLITNIFESGMFQEQNPCPMKKIPNPRTTILLIWSVFDVRDHYWFRSLLIHVLYSLFVYTPFQTVLQRKNTLLSTTNKYLFILNSPLPSYQDTYWRHSVKVYQSLWTTILRRHFHLQNFSQNTKTRQQVNQKQIIFPQASQ